MEPSPIVEELGRLGDRSAPDRPTRVMRGVCEAWDHLQRTADDALARALIRFLQNLDDLSLARAVLPALRHGADLPENSLQRGVVEMTADSRARLDRNTRPQRDFDHPYYLQEKEMLQEAEMHRLGLILYGTESLTDRESHHLRRWLAECPLGACDGPHRSPPPAPPGLDGSPGGGEALEKRALHEADAHVLRLLLFSSRTLTQPERGAVTAWLELCPMPSARAGGRWPRATLCPRR